MPMRSVLGQFQSRGQRLPPESNLAARGHFATTALPVLKPQETGVPSACDEP
jgi:hypothetical protein